MEVKEKRQHRRFRVQQPAPLLDIQGQEPPSYLFIENLSGGGSLVHSSAELREGTRIKLRLDLGFPLRLMGARRIQVVVWGRVIRSGASGTSGISFETSEILDAGRDEWRG